MKKKKHFDSKINDFVNQTVAKITNNLERFNYNVIIANMYETYNYLIKYVKENKDIENLEENYKKILICFSPVMPHISSECLMDFNCTNLEWPVFDKNILVKEKNRFVIQINGKKRALIEAKNDVSEKDLLEILKKDKIVHKYLINKEIKKVIFVKNRLMNILINE